MDHGMDQDLNYIDPFDPPNGVSIHFTKGLIKEKKKQMGETTKSTAKMSPSHI